MYLVDTNVVSELRRSKSGRSNERVVGWGKKVAAAHTFLSVVSLLELDMGVLSIERRDSTQGALLRGWLQDFVLLEFAERIVSLDTVVSLRCAGLHVPNRRPDRDAWIAATALVHRMTVVTRNVSDFEATGVAVFNPWTY